MSEEKATFWTVLALQSGWTGAGLAERLAYAAVDFIAHYDPTSGRCGARPAAALKSVELNSVAAATDLVSDDAYTVPTAKADLVDSTYRAKKILAEHAPARTLVVLDGDEPVKLFTLHTASASHQTLEEHRQWVTDMPNDESLMAGRLLLAGTTPWLRTRITDDGMATGEVSTIDLAVFRDRKISFGLIGENIAFRLPGEDGDLPNVDSEFLDPLGDDASYEVQLVPKEPGPAAVEIEIWFDDDENYPHDQRIDFTVIDAPGVAQAGATEAGVTDTTIGSAEVRMPFAAPPEASVWIRWDGDELAYDVDGTTETHAPAASAGAFDGPELGDLLTEIERLAGSYLPVPTVPSELTNPEEMLLAFARVGASLHALVYGADEHDVADEISQRARDIAALGHGDSIPRLRVEDDRFRLPWELFYDHGYARGPGESSRRLPETIDDVDISGFWGARFRIDHPAARGKRQARRPGDHVLGSHPTRIVPFVNANVADDLEVNQRLVERHERMFDGLSAKGADVSAASNDLNGFVGGGSASDILYVFGHGTGALATDGLGRASRTAASDQATLNVAGSPMSVADLKAIEPSPPQLAGSPLVILNACRTLIGDGDYSNPFIDLFYRRWHARAVLGGVSSLPSSFAVAFADRVLDNFVDGNRQLGECVYLTVRGLLDEGNPYGLMYALHGRSELQIRKTTS